jgi:NAD(P)H-hydrate repair Nnr-like enzyme with NAD(P)H-hydrate epimerase domain
MEEYGDLDEETESLPIKRNTKLIPIIAIDDVTGIFTDTGSNNIKNENSHQLAIKLKDF